MEKRALSVVSFLATKTLLWLRCLVGTAAYTIAISSPELPCRHRCTLASLGGHALEECELAQMTLHLLNPHAGCKMRLSQYSSMSVISPVLTVTFLCGLDPAVNTLAPLPAIRYQAKFTQPLKAADGDSLQFVVAYEELDSCAVSPSAKRQHRRCSLVLKRAKSPAGKSHADQAAFLKQQSLFLTYQFLPSLSGC